VKKNRQETRPEGKQPESFGACGSTKIDGQTGKVPERGKGMKGGLCREILRDGGGKGIEKKERL